MAADTSRASTPDGPDQVWFAEHALLPAGPAHDVTFEVTDGRFSRVTRGKPAPAGARRLPGVVLPGFANTHSHAFHRALRGRTHADGGTFWTWRTAMYRVAARLDPDRYYALARAVFTEMVLAGMTSVGEFHYVHHASDGRPYPHPNAMTDALARAAHDAGIRLTVLDTLYLSGGLTATGHTPLDDLQRRFDDGSPEAWAERLGRHRESQEVRVGLAIHSVRAVPRGWLPAVKDVAMRGRHARDRGEPLPIHCHVSEQPAENEAALAYYGRTPVELLHDAGLLGPNFTAVHATHLSDRDIDLLGRSRSSVSFCPTTERDLADGIGPARDLLDAGARVTLGSDQHAVVDMFEEVRGLEMDERLRSGERGRIGLNELLDAATAHASLGWSDAGALRLGARADAVCVDLDSPRTAGALPAQVLLAATNADVTDVFVDGRHVVDARRHMLGDAGPLLREAIAPLWD